MEPKKPSHRRSFTRLLKAEIVQRHTRGGRSITKVVRDIDLTESEVRARVAWSHHHTGWSTSGDRHPRFMTHEPLAVCGNDG
jgi:transposase-like protein